MIGHIRESFNSAIDNAIAGKSEFLSSGKAENFEHYKLVVGEIRGLKRAAEILTDVIKRHGEIDDD